MWNAEKQLKNILSLFLFELFPYQEPKKIKLQILKFKFDKAQMFYSFN